MLYLEGVYIRITMCSALLISSKFDCFHGLEHDEKADVSKHALFYKFDVKVVNRNVSDCWNFQCFNSCLSKTRQRCDLCLVKQKHKSCGKCVIRFIYIGYYQIEQQQQQQQQFYSYTQIFLQYLTYK